MFLESTFISGYSVTLHEEDVLNLRDTHGNETIAYIQNGTLVVRPVEKKPSCGWGRYILIVAGSPLRREWINIGMVYFDHEGKFYWGKLDATRAIKAGMDFAKDWNPDLATYLPDIESVHRKHQSMGHAMSSIQCHWGGAGTLEMQWVEHNFRQTVLGINDPIAEKK